MSHILPLPKRAALPVALGLALAVLGTGATGALAKSSAGEVYTLTNSPAVNAVKVFHRAGDGSLSAGGEFATGGSGTGGGLGNQGAVVLDGKRLFAVNAGSDSISAFKVKGDALELVDTVASGGDQPISLTAHDGLLYVLNAGGAGNIRGFTFTKNGTCRRSPDRLARSAAVGPARPRFRSIPRVSCSW